MSKVRERRNKLLELARRKNTPVGERVAAYSGFTRSFNLTEAGKCREADLATSVYLLCVGYQALNHEMYQNDETRVYGTFAYPIISLFCIVRDTPLDRELFRIYSLQEDIRCGDPSWKMSEAMREVLRPLWSFVFGDLLDS